MLRRAMLPVMAVVTVLPGTVLLVTRPAAGDSISSAKAEAAAIESQLTAAQNRMSALSQQYDAAAYKLQQINASIATTKATIATDQKQVSTDRTRLSKAAIANYVSDGAASSDNPIFSGNEKTVGAATEYNQIAAGRHQSGRGQPAHGREHAATPSRRSLQAQQGQAQQAVAAEQAAVTQNAQEIQVQQNALAQENGQDRRRSSSHSSRQKRRPQRRRPRRPDGAAEQAKRRQHRHERASGTSPGLGNCAPPPTAPGGAGAVQAAESQLGVPYVWGGESPRGSAHPGFDCSGLTA